MDLKPLDTKTAANEGRWCTIYHPITNEPLDIQIKLAGADSDIYKKAINKQVEKKLKKGTVNRTLEQEEKEEIEILTACTLDWKNVEYEGRALECKPESIKFIYSQFIWLREQVDNFINDRKNYIG